MTQSHDFETPDSEPTQPEEIDSGSLSQFGMADALAALILEPAEADAIATSKSLGAAEIATPGIARAEITGADKRRIADLLWVQALLEQTLAPQPVQREARIQRAMASLTIAVLDNPISKGESPVTTVTCIASRYRPQRSFRTAWVTALIVVIAVGLWFQATDQSRQARAAVEYMRQVAAEPRDREYAVTLAFTPPSDVGKDLPQQKLNGNLYVRGGAAFAFQTPALVGPGKTWMGGDAKGVWLRPARGPIVFQATAEGLLQRYLRSPVETPFMQITTVLERLGEHYDIELLADEVPPGSELAEHGLCHHIRGKCRNPHGSLPDTIDTWSARRGGNVIRMSLSWERKSRPGLLHVEFNFVKQAELPTEWYRPEGHPKMKSG
jgi:hypothetical protein